MRQVKILFLISDREVVLTGGRFLQLLYRLEKHQVTIASNSPKVLNHCDPKLTFVNKVLVKPQEYIWTMQQRDKFTKKFINAFHDIKLCDDIPMWKAEAFDDYLWNVSQFVYPQIEGQFDLILMPVPSKEEAPPHLVDEFYTSQLFKAKTENIPVCGLEMLPIQFCPVFFPKIFDYFVVKSVQSAEYLTNNYDFNMDKVWVINYTPDNYSLETIEDPFKHYLFKTVQPPRNELNVVVMNHVQKRDELKTVVKSLSELSVKVNIVMGLINYAVKELHEMEIVRDLLMPDFSKYFKHISFVDITDLPQLLISMDCFISMNHMTIFNWCDQYNIPYLVYDETESLKVQLENIWKLKKQQIGLQDIMEQISNEIMSVVQ